MKKKKQLSCEIKEPTHYSFFFLGLLWLAQFCPLLIRSALVNESFTGDLGIWAGIGHAAVLLIAAYEDLRYDTRHLPWIIVLAVIMNFLLGILASVAIWLILAAIITMAVIYIFFSGPFAGLLMFTLFSGINLGSFLLAILFIISAIVSGLIGLNAHF